MKLRRIWETADRLGELRSGQMTLELLVSPDVEGADLGFELEGPFELSRRDGELPRAHLRYTQIAGDLSDQLEFISNPDGAWVVVDEQAYELPVSTVEGLRGPGPGSDEGPLAGLELDPFTTNERSRESGGRERITADLDVVAAVNGAIDALGELGGGAARGALRPLEGEDASDLRRAVRSARLEMVTGAEDRLLRRLKLSMEIGTGERIDLGGGLGDLSGASVLFDLRIDEPNRPVEVKSPQDALPHGG